MKKLFILGTFILMVGGTAFAQKVKHKHHGHHKHHKHMMKHKTEPGKKVKDKEKNK